jgi:hypothetical protein
MELEVTQEQARKSVNAAFDSVNLINNLNALVEKSQEDLDTLARNVEHLKIMMAKDWFVAELTPEEKLQIEVLAV